MADYVEYDIAVVGGGPGGYVACIRAAQLGLRAVCIEREHLGGICLNWGCIPTKALLRSSEMFHHLQNLEQFGLQADKPRADLESIVKRSRSAAAQLNSGIKYLLKKNKVDVIEGEARLAGERNLSITASDGEVSSVRATNIILATGARARELPGINTDGDRIWSYKHAMTPKELPQKLLVIGSGAIGMEFASFYSDLGSEVTVVEALDRILPAEDREVSAQAEKMFTSQGLDIRLSARVTSITAKSDNAVVSYEQDETTSELMIDRVIMAVGITGNVEDLGLEDTGITVEAGHIAVDQWGYTGMNGIWAIGDVVGGPWLAHKASHEAVTTVEKIAGLNPAHPVNKHRIPACTYCRPQVASIGYTEEAAKEAGYELKIGRFPFSANGKAIAMGETGGFIKIIFDRETGGLLGAHMIGAEVTEMIQGYAIALQLESTEAEIIDTIFPHPTLSEAMHESVLDAYDRPIHI